MFAEVIVTLSRSSDIDVCPVWQGYTGDQVSELIRLVFRLVLNSTQLSEQLCKY